MIVSVKDHSFSRIPRGVRVSRRPRYERVQLSDAGPCLFRIVMDNQYRHHRIHQTLWMDYMTTRGNQPHPYFEVWNISPQLVSFQQEGRTPVRWRFAERNGFQVRTPTKDGWCHVLHTIVVPRN